MSQIQIQIKDLHVKQYEIFRKIVDTPASITKYYILRASRQSGKTFLLFRLALQFLLFKDNQHGIFASAFSKQYKRNWREFLEIVPDDLIQEIRKGENTIVFQNGSSIQFLTANNPDSAVGPSKDFLICDEAALYPTNGLDILTPCIDAKIFAKAVICSTPRGKNSFYKYCMLGMDEEDKLFEHYRMSYLDNVRPDGTPIFDVRVIARKRKTMFPSLFKSEYLSEFIFGNSSVFGDISKYQKIIKWTTVPVPGDTYYAAIDVSGAGDDSTIMTILNQRGEVVYIYECENTNLIKQSHELLSLVELYSCFTKVECNGLGQGLYDMMSLKSDLVSSFWMDNTKKNSLVIKAKEALIRGGLILPDIDLYPKLDSELSSYIAKRTSTGKLTYSHEKGFHDDTVDSLMIAYYTLSQFIGDPVPDIVCGIEEIKENHVPTNQELSEYITRDNDYDDVFTYDDY